MQKTTNRSLAVTGALLSLTLLPGCLFGSSTKTTTRGTYVSPETLAQVDAGDAQAEVLGLLGEPNSRSKKEAGGETWRWRYSEATTSKGSVFLLFGSESTVEKQHQVYVEFDGDGRVVKTWRD